MTKSLRNILDGIEVTSLKADESMLDLEISGITCDSRLVESGWMFGALPGAKVDGHDFIPQAAANGALAVIAEQDADVPDGVALIKVKNARRALALAAANWYDRPSLTLEVIGITGTNGKTTTTYLIESIIKEWGGLAGVIGTINYRIGEKVNEAPTTTPESVDFQKMLARMKEAKATHVIAEVSSHALVQERVFGTKFTCVVFTNLSRDHLDYHTDMEGYFQAKAKLFEDEYAFRADKMGPAVINIDDPFGERLVAMTNRPVVTYSEFQDQGARVWPDNMELSSRGISGVIHTPRGSFKFSSSLLGRVNLYNILASAAACASVGIPSEAITRGIEAVKSVPGRLERIGPDDGVTVLVDYSHTPAALEAAINTVKEFARGRVITVIGCGGDRDRGKRPLMGSIATSLSHASVITSDNPRSENPMEIIKEMLVGAKETGATEVELGALKKSNEKNIYLVEPDREKAIKAAIFAAKNEDVVLIAGKGHEDYQIIGSNRLDFDDREVARRALEPAACEGNS